MLPRSPPPSPNGPCAPHLALRPVRAQSPRDGTVDGYWHFSLDSFPLKFLHASDVKGRPVRFSLRSLFATAFVFMPNSFLNSAVRSPCPLPLVAAVNLENSPLFSSTGVYSAIVFPMPKDSAKVYSLQPPPLLFSMRRAGCRMPGILDYPIQIHCRAFLFF